MGLGKTLQVLAVLLAAKQEGKKKEDGMKQSQKLLLTWLIEDVRLFSVVGAYITPEDFTEELYRKAAGILFQQQEETGEVNPAKIVSLFEEEEGQREIASLFHAKIRGMEAGGEFEKALKETIIRVKQNSVNERLAHLDPTDLAGMQRIAEEKRTLEQLEKLHISIEKGQNSNEL